MATEKSLTDRVKLLRTALTGLGAMPSHVDAKETYQTLTHVLLVLHGHVMVDADGVTHPLCKHDGATRTASQCCKCGNVIKVTK
jgi:hypothetical protein